jgi:hypothetical protein
MNTLTTRCLSVTASTTVSVADVRCTRVTGY